MMVAGFPAARGCIAPAHAREARQRTQQPTKERTMKSIYSEDLADLIVQRVTAGTPLLEVLREEGVSKSAVYRWMREGSPTYNQDFAERMAIAREIGFDEIFEGCLVIADDSTNDWMERREARDGQPSGWTFNAEHVQRSKLRIETRLKLLAKWNPKRFGDRTVIAGDPEAPLQTRTTIDMSGLSLDQLRTVASIQLTDDSPTYPGIAGATRRTSDH